MDTKIGTCIKTLVSVSSTAYGFPRRHTFAKDWYTKGMQGLSFVQ